MKTTSKRLPLQIVNIVLALFCTVLGASLQPAAAATAPATVKAVLVTGASSGIGRKITEKLARDGYFVYAGARKAEDLKELGTLKNVQPLKLDVTKQQDIDAAVATITKAGRGLYGLVNNAGVLTIGSVAETRMDEFDTIMAVNVYGPWRMTRAFAPLITASNGRISTIGSIAGIFGSPQSSAYAMSKHTIEAFTDALAGEMAPLGVKVSVIEPGSYKSDILKNEVQRTGQGEQFLSFVSQQKEPDDVAAAVEQALFDANPKLRYLVVPDAKQAEVTIKSHITRLVQLNEGQPYTYDRDTLVKMLDEALANSRPRTK